MAVESCDEYRTAEGSKLLAERISAVRRERKEANRGRYVRQYKRRSPK
jgi:hypothetical protein